VIKPYNHLKSKGSTPVKVSDVIRVDPNTLHFYAAQLTGVAQSLRQVGSDVSASTSYAPSYDGQFGPQVASIGYEALSRSQVLADRLDALALYLRTKADEFAYADMAAEAAMMGAPPPGTGLSLGDLFDQIPWWVVLLLGIVPFGDALGLLEELINSLSGRGVSQLNLWLSIFGLAADAGWLDLLIPDPVDGVNVGLAGIKAAVKTLSLSPAAEKILLETLQTAVKNPDELGRIGKLLVSMAQNSDVAAKVIADEAAFRALLKLDNGAEILEQFVKHGDDALGRIDPAQAVRLSELAQDFGVDIHIAGKLADTPAEAAFRKSMAEEAEAISRTEGISFLEAQMQVAKKYGVDFYQVKVSSPGDVIKDADVFIDADQWKALSETQQGEIRQAIADSIGVDPQDVDFYQELDAIDPASAGLAPGAYDIPDPAHNVPPSSIHFGPDGSIDHPPLGNSAVTP